MALNASVRLLVYCSPVMVAAARRFAVSLASYRRCSSLAMSGQPRESDRSLAALMMPEYVHVSGPLSPWMVIGPCLARAAIASHFAFGSPEENAHCGPASEHSRRNCPNVSAIPVATSCLVSSGTVLPLPSRPVALPAKSIVPSKTMARIRLGNRFAYVAPRCVP